MSFRVISGFLITLPDTLLIKAVMENPEYIKLVRLAKDGNSVAFENLIEQNYLLVYKISYNWCRAKGDAEDIMQEVFVMPYLKDRSRIKSLC